MPLRRRDDYVKKIERFLGQHDIKTFHFEKRSKHRAVVVEHHGRKAIVIFPVSSCYWDGPRETIRDLRHALGLVGTKVAS